MSLTVLQKKIVNGVWSFFSYKIFKSQSKQCNLLFAFTTVKRMLSLLGLTTIGNRLLFMPRYFIKRSRISLFAVPVNPNTGVQLFNKERNSEMRKSEEQLPQKTVGRLLVNSRPTVGRQSADSRPTVGRQSDDSRPTVGQLLADCQPTVV